MKGWGAQVLGDSQMFIPPMRMNIRCSRSGFVVLWIIWHLIQESHSPDDHIYPFLCSEGGSYRRN